MVSMVVRMVVNTAHGYLECIMTNHKFVQILSHYPPVVQTSFPVISAGAAIIILKQLSIKGCMVVRLVCD